jgi:hypothetical protein
MVEFLKSFFQAVASDHGSVAKRYCDGFKHFASSRGAEAAKILNEKRNHLKLRG